MVQKKFRKGLLLVFTGNGKGKTTAAIGMTMRAVGHDFQVCFLQFIKGSWKYGEMEVFARFKDNINFAVLGRGFTSKSDDLEKDKEMARQGWERAKREILSGKYQLVVLDEFTYLLSYGVLDKDEVLKFLTEKPKDLHLIITGRGALPELIELADLVTEMKPVKHPFKDGVVAQRGVEF